MPQPIVVVRNSDELLTAAIYRALECYQRGDAWDSVNVSSAWPVRDNKGYKPALAIRLKCGEWTAFVIIDCLLVDSTTVQAAADRIIKSMIDELADAKREHTP